jgi:hypothetical protein
MRGGRPGGFGLDNQPGIGLTAFPACPAAGGDHMGCFNGHFAKRSACAQPVTGWRTPLLPLSVVLKGRRGFFAGRWRRKSGDLGASSVTSRDFMRPRARNAPEMPPLHPKQTCRTGRPGTGLSDLTGRAGCPDRSDFEERELVGPSTGTVLAGGRAGDADGPAGGPAMLMGRRAGRRC